MKISNIDNIDNTIYIGNYNITLNITTCPYTELPKLEFLISKEGSQHYCKCFDKDIEEAYNCCTMQEDFRSY